MDATCENYVVNKLRALEKENDILKRNIEELEKQLTKKQIELTACEVRNNEFQEVIKRHVKLRHLDSGSRYISSQDLNEWSDKERDDMIFVINFLGLVDEDVETEEENGSKE